MTESLFALYVGGFAASATAVRLFRRRWELSRAKHPSVQGHARISRRLAKLVPFYEYEEEQFFRSDDAPADVAARRRSGFERLAQLLQRRAPHTIELSEELESGLSDLSFTRTYCVPFQYARYVKQHLKVGSLAHESSGVRVIDLDGNAAYDLTGSYGTNVFGYDFYKDCIDTGIRRVRDLGPVLGSYHPVIEENVRKLKAISGLDEVSFHMSGTEAVMQAVQLARYHTGRSHLVRFCGAYHGWWDGVQPGAGNPRVVGDVYTLRDMDDASLRVLRTRNDIACVLVNPLQALHPNASAPGDATLIDSDRHARFDRAGYSQVAAAAALRLQRAIDRVDLRRGVRGIPDRLRRRPGVLRRRGRYGDVRQDAWRRPAGRSPVRETSAHEAFQRRTPLRHLFRPGHVQFAPLRDGRDERVPAPD